MPTDNPKISLYVPQKIYDRFRDFQQKQNLSMSQAGTVVLAEYFGLKETIKEITEGTTIGGVSLVRVEEIEKKLIDLEDIKARLLKLESKVVQKATTSEPNNIKTTNFELLPDFNSNNISVLTKLLAKRLGVKVKTLSTTKSKKGTDHFYEWSKAKDPDQIGWIPESKTTFTIQDQLSSEKLSILQNWIKENQ